MQTLPGDLISLADAAVLIGRSTSWCRRLVQTGRLKARKIGTCWLVSAADAEAFRPRPRGNPNFGRKTVEAAAR